MSWVSSARGLYAIVDPEHVGGRDPVAVSRAILAGGCAVLQLRAKEMGDGDWLALARELATLCHEAGVPFVVNDRADIARLAGADGLHLGQDDLEVADARRVVGAMPIGVSTHDPGQAEAAVRAGADLIGFGPVFDTATKENPDPTVGLETLGTVVSAVAVPVVAIGGIDAARASEVARRGAALWAAISAVSEAPDPGVAAAAMHAAGGGA